MEKRKRMFENRFNNLESKEYLKFQKSWKIFESYDTLFRDNIRFFTKTRKEHYPNILYYGNNFKVFKQIAIEEESTAISFCDFDSSKRYQFALFDLVSLSLDENSFDRHQSVIHRAFSDVQKVAQNIEDKRFICVLVSNFEYEDKYYPLAWELAKNLSTCIELKDEKINCLKKETSKGGHKTSNSFNSCKDVFYSLYFRCNPDPDSFISSDYTKMYELGCQKPRKTFDRCYEQWMVVKPRPRKKNELLHPAKYPENLIEFFIEIFTNKYDTVFDPMSGTGSTQVAALTLHRHAYGTELSKIFSDIASERCNELTSPRQMVLEFATVDRSNLEWKMFNEDARSIERLKIPQIDYLITSPPYWDMLNMKGAENQMKRKEKGLKINYSDDGNDLGNISDYSLFLKELMEIYTIIISKMKPGSFLTIIVKNIKKNGCNYPFAWDLSQRLSDKLLILPEIFWLQDDLSIAPYGYGNTWVSNTFHQYCLNFQVK